MAWLPKILRKPSEVPAPPTPSSPVAQLALAETEQPRTDRPSSLVPTAEVVVAPREDRTNDGPQHRQSPDKASDAREPRRWRRMAEGQPVSYTHLTLPTNREV